MPQVTRSLSFDAGIEQILIREGTPMALPDSGQVIPGMTQVEQRLDGVLFPPSLEQTLLESFRPEIDHDDMLTPVGYQVALDASREELRQAAENAALPAEKEALRHASEVLDDQKKLGDLLLTYRHLLHKG